MIRRRRGVGDGDPERRGVRRGFDGDQTGHGGGGNGKQRIELGKEGFNLRRKKGLGLWIKGLKQPTLLNQIKMKIEKKFQRKNEKISVKFED